MFYIGYKNGRILCQKELEANKIIRRKKSTNRFKKL
jgi:hypothetical protein